MRAAAVALVLIIGAVVILIFANTLNSWVLGGLIGGLAALLMSIPVSLLLFTILARRHDRELQALQQELEEMAFAEQVENENAGVYETDVYMLPDEEEFYNEPGSRRLPGVRALPPAGQSQASTAETTGFKERTGNYSQAYKRPSQALPRGRGKGSPTQHLAPHRRQPRRSSYEVNAMRSGFQKAALRAARREAALQFDNVENVSTRSPAPYKRVPPGRSSQSLTDQPARFRQAPPAHELSPRQQQVANQNRAHPVFDAASSSGEADSSHRHPRTDALRMSEPRTDQLRDRNPHPQTEPFRVRPQTGQIVRNPQLGEQLRNPEAITGSLKNPLVRRPPYMYEDDPLREELAQQIDGGPIMRRSSRFLQYEEEE